MKRNDKRPDRRSDVPRLDEEPLQGTDRSWNNRVLDKTVCRENQAERLNEVYLLTRSCGKGGTRDEEVD